MKNWLQGILLLFILFGGRYCQAQRLDQILIPKMESYELDIQNTYREYQKIYYEQKSSLAELRAFEDIISVYVSQILEIHETLTLSGFSNLESPRDIAARALIYRALIFLEKAPLNVHYYEQACYDYYKALAMFEGASDKVPALFKPSPNPVKVGNKEYTRLIDVIDNNSSELYAFGKVELNLQNFKITTNLNIDDLEFFRVESPIDKKKYTYLQAEKLIKEAFRNELSQSGSGNIFLALPEGSYIIRSKSRNSSSRYTYLSAIYVRANQQHNYIVEPLMDWFIAYENPTTSKPQFIRPNAQHESPGQGNGYDKRDKPRTGKRDKDARLESIEYLSGIVDSSLAKVDVSQIFNLRDAWIRSKFASTVAEVMLNHIESLTYYNCWSDWMLAWIISQDVTQKFSPETEVPTELIKMVYMTLGKI
ncbi:MAG: hypothetical protein ACOY90_05295 [Candidatus Zhuqueibacterota bacterium]